MAGCIGKWRVSALVLFAALAVAQSSFSQGGALRAGAAKVDITPPVAPDSDPPTGKFEHERLYVRAIVLDNGQSRAALIGADQSGLSDAVWAAATKSIAADLNCPVSSILISATHTHSPGTALGGPPQAGGAAALNPFETVAVNAMVAAVKSAKAKLQPAELTFGTGTAYLNVNRDAVDPVSHKWTQAPNTLASSDKTVAVLTFQTLAGEPIGVYVNYAMHPVNGYLANFTSSDFAGAMSRYIENAFDDKAIAIFSQGASGDQNPLYLRAATNGMASRSGSTIPGKEMVRESVEAPLRDGGVTGRPMDAKTRERLERWMESEGDVLAEEAIRVMTNATRAEKNVRIAGSQTTVTCPGRKRTDQGREGMTGTYADGPDVPLRIGALVIGDVVLGSVNAEIYSAIGQRLKRESPMANTVMVTLANGRAPSGYIPDDVSFSHNTFQALGSRLKVGCAESAIADGITGLITATEKP